MGRKSLLCFIGLLTFCFYQISKAQKLDNIFIGTSFHYGSIVRHNNVFKPTITEPSFATEIHVIQQTNGTKKWHHLHNFPQIGLSAFYGHFGNTDIFGKGVGLLPNLFLDLYRSNKLSVQFKVGVGLAYLTKRFDVKENPINNVIGSTFNNITSIQFIGEYHQNKHGIQLLLGGTHFSNASVQMPNLGINFLSVGLGYRYYSKQPVYLPFNWDTIQQKAAIRVNFRTGVALKERKHTLGPKYYIYSYTFLVSRLYHEKHNFHAGIMYEQNHSINDFITQNNLIQYYNSPGGDAYSLLIGDEIILGHMGLNISLGYYLYNPILKPNSIYFKLGVQHHFVQKDKKHYLDIAPGIFLKAHQFTAELLEFSLAITY